MSPLLTLLESPPKVPEAVRESLDRLRETFADCLASGGTLPPSAEIARIRRFCEPIFQQRYSSPQARLHDIEQLEQVAGAHANRGRFLSELALDPPTSTSDLAGPPLLDEDYLILSTVHSAKGGEWDVVHVIHAADGMIPSDMSTGDHEAIEEERRLFYVALTRARDNLYVYFALRFYRRPRGLDDAHHFAQLTRFLPEPVQSLFERRSAGEACAPTGLAGRGSGARESVNALLTALWEA
jgi:DNA helicase-2/ATP-dependent DNA helicase PcrA